MNNSDNKAVTQPAGDITEAQFYRQLAENLSDLIVTTDMDLNLTYISPSAEGLLGYSSRVLTRYYNEWRRKRTGGAFAEFELFLRQELTSLNADIKDGDQSALPMREFTARHRDGRQLCFEVHTSPLCNDGGEMVGMLCVCREISARKATEENLALAAKVFENSLTGIYITDNAGKIIQVNKAFARITGYRPGEAVGQPPALTDVEHYSPAFFKSIADSLERKDYWEGEIQHRHKDGRVFPSWVAVTVLRDSAGKVINTITTFTDITEKKNSEVRIQRLAYFDPLTGLPNRSLFNDRLGQSLNRARRSDEQVGLLFLDLDRFKAINDSLGHALGDALLQQVAQRLRECVRNEDTVARMGGDEFTVILGDLSDRQHAISAAAHVAEKIRHALNRPFKIDDREVFSGASIGISFFPGDGSEPKTLLQNADTAMYHAKAAGKNNYQFYTSAMNLRALERLEIENALHQAIHQSQFELYFQPIMGAESGEVVAVEALVRWNHPEYGMTLPNKFISIAEESGLIKQLGAWVLHQACEQLVQWQAQGKAINRVAVNVSGRQFVEGYIVQTLREVIGDTGIDPQCLELELTESTLMQDHKYSLEALEIIKRMGVRISIDDFGTGYSSLNYLKKFPIDTLKVDKSFIEGLPDKEDQQIVQAIVALARSLNLKVIAEGVENANQLAFLQGLGCEEVQGFMLCQPQSAQDIGRGLLH